MGANSGKLATGLLLLIGVWIGVYWMYEPSKPKITLDPEASRVEREPVDASSSASMPTLPPAMRVEPATTPDASRQTPRMVAVVPPEFLEYTVQAGDTFESISTKFYQSPQFAEAITRANGLGDAGRLLTPGRTIRVARDPRNVQGVAIAPVPELTPQRDLPPPVPTKPTPEVAKAKEPRTYTVQSGDSLSRIAKRFYDDASAWERIYEANKDSMKGPHDLKLGAVLVIPE